MASLIGKARRSLVKNKLPVSYTRSSAVTLPTQSPSGMTAHLDAMGAVGTLYAIVHRTSNATAQVNWRLWRKARSGKPEDRVEVTKHAALDLWNKPNQFATRQELVETFQQHLELAGEAWLVVGRNPAAKLPLELWVVRPDRMEPRPHPDKFIEGYNYLAPDGGKVPLDVEDVIFLRTPDPRDPYRGMSPVGSILSDLEATKYSSDWNRNFFLNSAEPGGVIEYEERLSDDEFDEITARWAEQHRGVSNAHRVAIIEQGKWVSTKYTQRDMQFVELRNVSRDTIREAYAFPKPMLGASDDVNRANAEAAEVVFARWLVVPRLERIKQALNNDLLPLFGDTARDLEFDYDNPVPDDVEALNNALTAKANAAVALVGAGWVPDAVLETVDLPQMDFEKPEPPKPPALPGPPGGDEEGPLPAEDEKEDDAETEAKARRQSAYHLLHAKGAYPTTCHTCWDDHRQAPEVRAAREDVDSVDLAKYQAIWEQVLDEVMRQWPNVTSAQRDQLVQQVVAAIDEDDLDRLTELEVDTEEAAALIAEAMTRLATESAYQVVQEAQAQGVYTVVPMVPLASELALVAGVTATLLAAELALSAAREAMRVRAPGVTGTEVARAVGNHLRSLKDGFPRVHIGGALTGAQNAARIETMAAGPVAALYANEKMDGVTCGPCRTVHGRWLGNTDNASDLVQVARLYPTSGYVDCEGGPRCRGTVSAVWRPKTTSL